MQTHQVSPHSFQQAYFHLIHSLYPQGDALNYHAMALRAAFDYTCGSSHQTPTLFVTMDEDSVVGCIGLIKDDGLPGRTAFFGFMECLPGKQIFPMLWEELVGMARGLGIPKLHGPINGTIWHPYRVISRDTNNEPFPSELLSQAHYFELLRGANPSRRVEYISAYRTNLDLIVEHTARGAEVAARNGFTIDLVHQIDMDLLRVLHSLSLEIFSASWSYTPLSFTDFTKLYNSDRIKDYVGSLYVAREGDRIIGYAMNIEREHTLVMKTIGVLPQYQQLGIANGLVHRVHADARGKGVERVVYALVNRTNNIKYFPQDEIFVIREYEAYEYQIA